MKTMDPKFNNMELSTRILIKESLARGIKVDILDMRENFIRLKKGDKTEYVKQATRTSADSYITALIMENKSVTKKILQEHNINVPLGRFYNNFDDARKDYEYYKGMNIVIKPNTTNFGIGISILKEDFSKENYLDALRSAFDSDNSVIVEEFITGDEYRFLIINDRVIGILQRIPANVRGDGIHTIKELIEEKNKDSLRGEGYRKPLEKITMGQTEASFLKKRGQNFDFIPQEGEVVFLRKNSNISTGGDSIDFTDEIIDEYKEIAVRSAKAVNAKICGADIIIKNINEKPDKKNHSIIELNFNPALHIHAFPFKGINRHPEKYVLDLLEF